MFTTSHLNGQSIKQSALLAFIFTSAHVLGGRARASVKPLRSLNEDVYVCPCVRMYRHTYTCVCMYVSVQEDERMPLMSRYVPFMEKWRED